MGVFWPRFRVFAPNLLPKCSQSENPVSLTAMRPPGLAAPKMVMGARTSRMGFVIRKRKENHAKTARTWPDSGARKTLHPYPSWKDPPEGCRWPYKAPENRAGRGGYLARSVSRLPGPSRAPGDYSSRASISSSSGHISQPQSGHFQKPNSCLMVTSPQKGHLTTCLSKAIPLIGFKHEQSSPVDSGK
ncbi:hypothetical protein Desku_1412 [Desulfofundulus kuznetsovii DSM 6115]|uniref:Uncharacterized protein n=1 Tax=Desulfofundulus kuznetsovii (strain DSM 6115 / VKM B-1805 / 17) TaxID=760568 RepID=A0AAU8PPN5_DESK7|nr:hypothetical protein Desku_1412 [Desulfofundulus kuznetsovii DSM 6115]